MKSISLQSEGQRLDGHLFIPTTDGKKYPGVLLLHGLTSNEANYIPIAEGLSKLGIAAMTVNMRGHGTSEGIFENLTVQAAMNDGIVAFDFFAHQASIDTDRIGICGASLGAAVAAIIGGERSVKSMVLRVPAAYPSDRMDITYGEIMSDEDGFFQRVLDPLNSLSLQAMQEFNGNLLIITSGEDKIIPKRIPDAYLSAALTKNKELRVIAGASHNLNKSEIWRKQFIDWSIDWFRKTL